MITQEELNKLYYQFEERIIEGDDDPDDVFNEFRQEINHRGGRFVHGDWKEYGTGGLADDFVALLKEKTGAIVLEDPQWEGSDEVGFIVFFPDEDKANA